MKKFTSESFVHAGFLTAETPRRGEEKRGWKMEDRKKRLCAILYLPSSILDSPSSFSPRLSVSAVNIRAKNAN
jgi:hypothetical protein